MGSKSIHLINKLNKKTMLTSRKGIPVGIIGDSAVAINAGATTYQASKLYVGGAGSVTVTTASGQTGIVFAAVPAGSVLPVLVTAVTAATATSLVLIS